MWAELARISLSAHLFARPRGGRLLHSFPLSRLGLAIDPPLCKHFQLIRIFLSHFCLLLDVLLFNDMIAK